MGMRMNMARLLKLLSVSSAFCLLFVAACTLKHKIEPSDKPFVVNLNIKIDHEIRMKIKEESQDILNMEEEYLKKQKKG